MVRLNPAWTTVLLLAAPALAATEWIWAAPFRNGLGSGIHYAEGLFIQTGGGAGSRFQSPDGREWRSFIDTTQPAMGLDRVVYVNGLLHGFNRKADSNYATSPDGIRWTVRPTPISCGLKDLAYGDGRWVGVSHCTESTTVSTDGVTWTRYTSNTKMYFHRIRSGNGTFVAMSQDGRIAASATGGEWDVVQSKANGLGLGKTVDLAFGNGRFVIVGQNGQVQTSADGKVWKDTLALRGFNPYALIFAGGWFVATSWDGGAFRSRDGLAWSQELKLGAGEMAVAYGNGRYLAIGDKDIAYSDDSAATWTRVPGRTSTLLNGGAHTGTHFIVVGSEGALAVSRDGLAWSEPDLGLKAHLREAVWGNGRAVVIGQGGTILSSSDAETWEHFLDPRLSFRHIVFGGGEFVATTDKGTIYASKDGMKWDSVYAYPKESWIGPLSHGNGIFLAGNGSLGGISQWSSDGRNWNRVVHDSLRRTMLDGAIVHGPEGFFMAHDRDSLLHSVDGRTFRKLHLPALDRNVATLAIRSLIRAEGKYIGIVSQNSDEFLFYSADGKEWVRDSQRILPAYGLIHGGGKYLVFTRYVNGMVGSTSRFDPDPAPLALKPARGDRAKRGVGAWVSGIGTREPGEEAFTVGGRALGGASLPQGRVILRTREAGDQP
jgi:hypothetical protein